MKFLPPVPLRDAYWRCLAKEVERAFYLVMFKPLWDVLGVKDPDLQNDMGGPLYDAIKAGSIWYDDGGFSGEFNAKISAELKKIGAVFNLTTKRFMLPRAVLPVEILTAQVHADMRYDALRRAFLSTLDNMNIGSVDSHVHTRQAFETAINWMDDDFNKSVQSITIQPKLPPAQKQQLAEKWSKNLDLYITDFAKSRISKMRDMVQQQTFEGRRAIDLAKMLQGEYGISKRKAEFLARQETSLLLSKFKETRYSAIGVTKYRWSTSRDERVRHDHKDLNTKIFSFTLPPVTNLKTGARNNPGEDFNCRCVAIGIVE